MTRRRCSLGQRSGGLRLSECVLLSAAVALAAGCSSLPGVGRATPSVFTHPAIAGRDFEVLGLISAEDSRDASNVSARVRMRLEEGGLVVLRTPGTWATEQDVMIDLCERPGVDGVVFAKFDAVRMRACQPNYPEVFDALGGRQIGVDELMDHLLRYLERPREAPVDTASHHRH
jgi:hypothetical protein